MPRTNLMQEFTPYLKASQNESGFIKNWIANHPEKINEKWSGISQGTQKVKSHIRVFAENASLGILGVGALFVPVVGTALCCFAITGQIIHSARHQIKDRNLVLSRRNWTLLEFALEAGASEVAVILILKGAKVTSLCEKILEIQKTKCPQFFNICRSAIDKQTELLTYKNRKVELEHEIKEVKKEIKEILEREEKLKKDLKVQNGIAGQDPDRENQLSERVKHLEERKNQYKFLSANLMLFIKKEDSSEDEAPDSEYEEIPQSDLS